MSNPTNYSVQLNTNNECFIGNLNKQKTRDEIFQDLTSIEIKPLKENLYISKFNMPKFNARKDQNGNLLLNLGYAFVTTKKPEMAQWLIQQKRIELPDGSDIEIKPISKTKRLTANQNCKNKNFSKMNGEDVNERYTKQQKSQHGAIGDGRKYGSNEGSRESMNENSYDSNNVFGGYNDSLSNALNNSVNSSSTAYFHSKMHDNHFGYNSAPVDNGNSLFNTRVSQSDEFTHGLTFDRNYAPASLDYKKTSPIVSPKEINTNLWNPFFEQQTDSNSSNSNSSTHFSPTNTDQTFNFHASRRNI